MAPRRSPSSSQQRDRLELVAVTPEEYNESLKCLKREDAIMDESIFTHMENVISYLYTHKDVDPGGLIPCKFGEEHITTAEEYATELNRGVLNKLVEGYVGYAWLCEVCARWILHMKESSDDKKDDNKSMYEATQNLLYEALMSYIKCNYDSEKMRLYMEDKHDHGKWNPPELYWNLMKSSFVASCMMKIYRDKPKDPFLSSWYQDYIKYNSDKKRDADDISNESLSRITSNFSVFTLRISEEIRSFLLKDDLFDALHIDSISPLFCHAENAYIYSQALLHFIYQWRIDLRGCRRLSQLVAKSALYPTNDPNVCESADSLGEWSASQIHLLMTNFARFPALHASFKRLTKAHWLHNAQLNPVDVCDFYSELVKTLDAFDKYGLLLFHRHDNVEKPEASPDRGDCGDDIDVDPSVSQYGDRAKSDEYTRLRDAPEMPPLEAIRESELLNVLISEFSNPDFSFPDLSWIKYANLLVFLSVLTPYELLYAYYDERVVQHLKTLPQNEVWKQFYLPPADDTDDILEEIEQMRDFGLPSEAEDDDDDDDEEEVVEFDIQRDDTFELKSVSGTFNLQDSSSAFNAPLKVKKAWRVSSDDGSSTLHFTSSPSFDNPSSCMDSQPQISLGNISSRKRRRNCTGDNSNGGESASILSLHDTSGNMLPLVSEIDRKESKRQNVDDCYLEIKSTLASAIYKNANEGVKLGPSKTLSPEIMAEMKELYNQFKKKCERVKGIASKELYQLYRIIRGHGNNEMEMQSLISTNIAASVVVSYIEQRVKKNMLIGDLCDVKILLLKSICDVHPPKRPLVAAMLRDMLKGCTDGSLTGSSTEKLGRMEAIVDLLVYLARFERQCLLVVTVFDEVIAGVDRSISRRFVSNLLKYCGPPYSLVFAKKTLGLVAKFIELGCTGLTNTWHEKDNLLIKASILPFLKNCAQVDPQMVKRCEEQLGHT